MSSVLQRLVARAAGKQKPGLQARLPARFEAGGMTEDGFSERVEEVAAEPRHAREESSPRPVREVPASESMTEDVRAESVEARFSPDMPSPAVPKRRTEPEREDRQDDGPLFVEVREGSDGTSVGPAPLLTAEERVMERVVKGERLVAESAPPSAFLAGDEPPEPLLPTEPAEREVGSLPVAPMPAQRVERGTPLGEPLDTQPPEISIHIGRIEVRGEAEKAAPRKRAPRELKLSSLSDFLDGGAS
ncbi:hypothetical protein [uncultured Tateyamaria sp.]|uniref:hypothetical protein n=1 Tax=uncultured Tateyamaria sp. TaxID=455651 RepID=UPI002608F619|nr:hypothetical protein [uncultured Tateyamaria sp.]